MPHVLRLSALALVVLLAAGPAAAQSSGMTLVGQFAPTDNSHADIWGYTAPDGTEYALLCDRYDGLSIIDISGTTPVQVDYVTGTGDSFDVKVYGHYAYLSHNESFADIQIIDLTDPSNAQVVGTLDADGPHNILIDGDYLYTIGGSGAGGLRIWSLTNPTAPSFVGSYEPYYYHDVHVRGDTLYAAAIYGEGVDILDISNKANPSLIANFDYPGSGAHNVCTTEDGSYAFVGDEIGFAGNWTRVFDVRDPQNVTLVTDIIIDPDAVVHNCYVEGDLLYLAHYGLGVRVFDISDPTNPVEYAYYVTPRAWTAYPYFASGKIIASDGIDGLYVFTLDNPPAPAVTASLTPQNPPISIPASGGTFSYTASLTNTTGASATVDSWVMATLPNGSAYGPVAGPRTLTLTAGQTFTRALSANVPAGAPSGTYTLTLNVGTYPATVTASDSFTFVKSTATAAAAATTAAFGAYPNPFAARTTIRFTLDTPEIVRLTVFDALGRTVAVLVDGSLAAGTHEATLDAADLPSGTYFARLVTGETVTRHTLTLTR